MDIHTYLKLDATNMAELIRKKEVTPTELLEMSFGQLEKVNPSLNAIAHLREEKVLEEANSIEIGKKPFAGVPIFLKDAAHALKGERLTSGARLFKDVVSKRDAHFVTILKDSGFLFLGHSTTPEFSMKGITEPELHGPTRNPWHTNHSPGGSSGGSAALVASGVVPAAGASDGGGSIRIPASYTSLFGLKPTRGRTPVGPGVGRAWQGAAVGFMLTRTVRDSAALLDILQVVQPSAAFQVPPYAGSYKEDMTKEFDQPLRIAFTTDSPVGTPVSEEAKKAVKQVVKWLEGLGHRVEEKENGVDGVELVKAYYLMNSGEMAGTVNRIEKTFGRPLTANDMEMESWVLNKAGQSVSAAEYSASLATWDRAAERMAELHEQYDFYITPATAFPAPKIGELTHSREKQDYFRSQIETVDKSKHQELVYDMFHLGLIYSPFTALANLTGQPAMSLPVHLTHDRLPLGVQVIASKGDEIRLLQLAHLIEQSKLWVGMKGNPYFTF